MTATSDTPTIPLSVFILGALWAIGFALTAPATLVFSDLIRWRAIDWIAVGHLAFINALLGIGAYWRKYAALLKLPPSFQQARDLAEGVRVTRTTTTAIVQETTKTTTEPLK